MHIRNAVFLIAPALLFGQPTSNVVSVTVSNPSNAQPDQAVFILTVNSGIDKNLSDIVGARWFRDNGSESKLRLLREDWRSYSALTS
jgi:hypothetical protein